MAVALPKGRRVTAEELERMPGLGRCELVKGEVIPLSPTQPLHGWVVTQIAHYLRAFVGPLGPGRVFTGDVGVVLERDPDTVRAPDLCYLTRERLPEVPTGYFRIPPDLVVEAKSPDEPMRELQEKMDAYLRVGVRLGWLVWPERHEVRVFRPGRPVDLLRTEDTLSGEDVLPGFSVPVGSLL